jgi:hypothetical protein
MAITGTLQSTSQDYWESCVVKWFGGLLCIGVIVLASNLGSENRPSGETAAALKSRYEGLARQYAELDERYQSQRKEVEDVESRSGIIPILCGGRLTTQTGVPYSITNRTAQSTIFFTPYQGNRITLYSGGRWKLHSFAQISTVLSGLTAGANYDIFAYNNSGTVALEVGTAWTNATTRAVALTSLNGVLVSSGDSTRRYIGTFRAVTTTTTNDAASSRLLWNLCNRGRRSLQVTDGTNTWAYALSPWRQVRATAANTVAIVVGVNDSLLSMRALLNSGTTTGMVWVSTGIGIDSTTVSSAQLMGGTSNANFSSQVWAEYLGYPGLGYHDINWLETTDAAASVTFYGDNGSTALASGMIGWVEG